MKFGLFYEHQLPQPWGEDSELRLYQQALDQIELADRLGIDYVWEVEHHFLEEYSHSSAPEVFLAACSQRTKQIRLGHGPNSSSATSCARRKSGASWRLMSRGRIGA
jgi:alkanesulfonate monooxygenase SsuD/methylene tetrahydromethanopterin reductase-like flavin-dependent oxidoreductase (luciferase family)